MNLSEEEKALIYGPDLWCGRTSPEHSVATKEKISEQSCKKLSGSFAKKPPLFLILKMDGQQPDALLEWGGESSIAWRVFDAQFWGVPQRRRRIALVADFGGATAGEILFERKGVSGDFTQSRTAWKETSAYAETGIVRNDSLLGSGGRTYDVRISSNGTKNWRAHCYETDISRSLDTAEPNPDSNHGGVAVVAAVATQQGGAENNQPVICIQGNCIDRADTAGCNGKGWTEDVSYTLNTIDRPAVAMAVENHPNDSRVKLSDDGIVQTLSGRMGTGGGNTPMVLECYSQGGYGVYVEGKTAGTLRNAGGDYGGGSETLIIQPEVVKDGTDES